MNKLFDRPKIFMIGGSGFIGKYIMVELLECGYPVHNFDLVYHYPFEMPTQRYKMTVGDAKDEDKLFKAAYGSDIIINLAAKIGGIAYFHKYPAEIMAENERIQASVFEVAKRLVRSLDLDRVIQVSSSMVFESTNMYPSMEGDELLVPPPMSSYGFQKLATEYWCKAYQKQYGVPYTIVRPFNVVGIGEDPLQDSHVIPQLIYKLLTQPGPLHILGNGNQIRAYTHGSDIARAVRMILESSETYNSDFNVANPDNEVTVLELAEILWNMIRPEQKFEYVSDPGYTYDVQKRVPDISKLGKYVGWSPKISLHKALEEVIEEIRYGLKNRKEVTEKA